MLRQKYVHQFDKLRAIATFQDIHQLPHEQYVTNILFVISVANIIISLIIMILGSVSLVAQASTDIVIAMIIAPAIFVFINAWVLQRLRAGKKEQAGQILTICGILLISLAVLMTGGLYSSAYIGLLFMFVTGVVLIDFKVMRWIYLGTFVYTLALFLIERGDYLPMLISPVLEKDLPIHFIALLSGITGLLLIISYHKYALLESGRRMAGLQAERERYRVQNEMTQNLAHDLRTPVTVMKSKMYLIKRYTEKGIPTQDKLSELEVAIENTHAMIEDLLALTMIDRNEQRDSVQTFNVREVLLQCIDAIRSYADENNTQIIFDDSSEKDIIAHGSQQQWMRVFSNLIENAIHYGCENCDNRYIKVRLQPTTDAITIQFEDNGIGIAPQDHERVFERFYRVNAARTHGKRPGTGIGLSIVRKIIEMHGGRITLASAIGRGSTFTVTLPY
ncbi:MAG: HAMP domain-containing sensor histidine kinase [Chloroflexota bacterium]